MKGQVRFLALIICIIFSGSIQAQEGTLPVREPDYNKPRLFTQFPQKISCYIENLISLFDQKTGAIVNPEAGAGFHFRGTITSLVSRSEDSVTSMVIRSADFPGAILHFSRQMHPDNHTTYTGRIISLAHGDAFELRFENNQYYFIKKDFYDLINE